MSGPNTCPSLKLPDAGAEQPEAHAGDDRQAQTRGASVRLVLDARDQDDRDDRQRDPADDHLVREALGDEPHAHRDHRGQDGGDRRDDGHPADGQGAIQARDADPAGDPTGDAPAQVRTREQRLAQKHGQREREGHPDDLRDEHDPEDRGPPAGQAATEVARAPRDRRGQPEDHGARRAGEEVDQDGVSAAGWASGSASPSSRAVGPGNSTTESAALS